jgi:hypothetical protein
MVTVWAAVGLLSPWLPNPRVAGDTVTGCTPVPVRPTVGWMASEVPEKVRVAERAPVAWGSNQRLIVQLLSAASVLPVQVFAVGGKKSSGLAPVMETFKFVAEL